MTLPTRSNPSLNEGEVLGEVGLRVVVGLEGGWAVLLARVHGELLDVPVEDLGYVRRHRLVRRQRVHGIPQAVRLCTSTQPKPGERRKRKTTGPQERRIRTARCLEGKRLEFQRPHPSQNLEARGDLKVECVSWREANVVNTHQVPGHFLLVCSYDRTSEVQERAERR